MKSSYTKQFRNKNSHKKKIIFSFSILIIVLFFYIIYINTKSNNQQKDAMTQAQKLQKNMAAPGIDNEADVSKQDSTFVEETDETEEWEKKTNKVIDKMNKDALERRKKKTRTKTVTANMDQKPELKKIPLVNYKKKKNPKTETKGIIDMLNKCRYSFTIEQHLNGGANLLVMDTYTGEIRIKRNFNQNSPVKLFSNETSSSKRRRFFEIVSYQIEGGNDIFILDSFTGKIKCVKKFTTGNSLKLFNRFENKGYMRYSASIWYNNGAIDFYIMDDCTSEIRIKPGLIKSRSVSIFSDDILKPFSFPRYSFWTENDMGRVKCFIMDNFTSMIKINKDISQMKSLQMFKKNDAKKSRPRYYAWTKTIVDNNIIFVFDAYMGRLKKVYIAAKNADIRLFANNSDDDAWMRYRVFVNYLDENIEMSCFDSVTGKFIVKNISYFEDIKFFEGNKKTDPKECRYSISLQDARYDEKVGVYIMDSYTSEIRRYIKSHKEKEVMLF